MTERKHCANCGKLTQKIQGGRVHYYCGINGLWLGGVVCFEYRCKKWKRRNENDRN